MSEESLPGGQDRTETTMERYDRNWADLIQELWVTQTGTQIVAGFLLTLAFQSRFTELDTYQVTVYVVLVLLAAVSTALGLAPVGIHRALTGMHRKADVVKVTNRIVKAILIVVALLTSGVVMFIFDVVIGRVPGLIAGGASLLMMTAILWAVPYRVGQRNIV